MKDFLITRTVKNGKDEDVVQRGEIVTEWYRVIQHECPGDVERAQIGSSVHALIGIPVDVCNPIGDKMTEGRPYFILKSRDEDFAGTTVKLLEIKWDGGGPEELEVETSAFLADLRLDAAKLKARLQKAKTVSDNGVELVFEQKENKWVNSYNHDLE
ncbi:hypothetical protein KW786_01200 [Candidatus Parcubacteria bacterium]|nr:hypothetical protein [Candidatus Parcubacteria bacterium]